MNHFAETLRGMAKKKRLPPAEMAGLPERLRAEMARGGWSQHRLAKAAGVQRSRIILILQGEKVDGITAAAVLRIAKALGVSVDWLLAGRAPGEVLTFVDPAAPPEVRAAFIEKLTAEVASRLSQQEAPAPGPSSEDRRNGGKPRRAKGKR